MNIASLFNRRLDGQNRKKTALVLLRTDGTEERYSWNDYINKATYIAEWLRRGGIKKGDFVAIIPLNLPNSFFAMLGTILVGAVPVPINIQLLKEAGLVDLIKIIRDCKPKFVLIDESLKEFLLGTGIVHHTAEKIMIESKVTLTSSGHRLIYYHASYPTAESSDLLIMPYTSGTSGQPKGVMLTHKNVINRLEAACNALSATEDEKILSYLPLGHIAELITTFFGQIYSGYTVYFTEHAKEIIENKEKFRKNFPSILQTAKPTIFIAVPRIWMAFRKEIETKLKNMPLSGKVIPQWLKKLAVKKGLGLNQTRVFVSAGAKISDEDSEFFSDLGVPISDIYGQTETAGPLTLNGTVLGPSNKMTLEKEEITVVGDCVMAGYFQNTMASNHVFSINETGETVYHTGDTGKTCKEKMFWTGRMGDSFKMANGEYVSPDKIMTLEEEIKKIDPQINEVIVCGANRPHLGTLIFSENYLDINLHEKIRHELPKIGEGMFTPRKFVLINNSELELTPTMKVKRKVMLEKLSSTIDSLYSKK
ncbi:MAG: AMP-binding protein [Candidatus Yanofskybacteria bacterium]|nr:AMP-binding protein [Candidatus Yanofskybacteria bacterium]